MNKKLGKLIESNSRNLSEFSRTNDIPYGTLYDIVKGKANVENIGIGVFMKIAKGLGMTAEELYYGKTSEEPIFSDSRQSDLNHHYESLNDQSKTNLVDFVKSYASDPERRIEKDGAEDVNGQAAMGE